MSKYPSVAIVGAGIGGLATANALLRRGFTQVNVYEQAAKFIPTAGAGFGFSPNGQMCLSSIGIDDYKHVLHPFKTIQRIDKFGEIKQSSNVLEDIKHKFGFGIAGCLRADLVDILAKPLGGRLHYSTKMVSISQDKSKVHIEFENGIEENVDLVIGADGIHSTVAEQLQIDPSPPVYSGANIFYGVIPNPGDKTFEHDVLRESYNKVITSPGTGEMITFNAGSPENMVKVWAVTYAAKTPPEYSQEWDFAGQTVKDLDMILDKYPQSHPIHELVHHTSPDRILHFGLNYRKHKRHWSKGRVCLIGDACHATLPYAGQGANQAVEDAVVLASYLEDAVESGDNFEKAFEQFYDKRNKRTRRIVFMANILDRMYHSKSPIVHMALEYLLSNFVKNGIVFKQIEKEIVEGCPVDYTQFTANR